MNVVFGELYRMFPVRWGMTRVYRLPTDDPGQPYYIGWSPLPKPYGEGWCSAQFDHDGVLCRGSQYNPVSISQFALFQYGLSLSGDSEARSRFFAQVLYLLGAQRSDGTYPYGFPVPAYDVRPGWVSAMAQGEAASVLLRAYALTREARYLEAGLNALEPLKRDVSVGGASYLRDGLVFFEEVASERPCHILNGHLYAAFAVWEVCRFGFADETLRRLHETAVSTLEQYLPLYDVRGWSCYDLAVGNDGRRHWAPLWYHQFHIAQLLVYASMTGRGVFAEYADRWKGSLERLPLRIAVWRYNFSSLGKALARRAGLRPPTRFKPLPLSSDSTLQESPSRLI